MWYIIKHIVKFGGNMAKRFVVEDKDIFIEENKICIVGSEAKHIRVLRHAVGDIISVNKYLVDIQKIDKDKVYGSILGETQEKGVPLKNITLIQSYLKADKMEYVVQKAVELGVAEIKPVISRNTVVKLEEKDCVKKTERLNKIVKEAIGQCGRTDDVKVDNVKKLCNIDLSKYDLVILCYEKAESSFKSIEKNIIDAQNIAVIIGPEGGFDAQEVELICKNNNAVSVLFGERILRAETASVYMLSILDYLSQKR